MGDLRRKKHLNSRCSPFFKMVIDYQYIGVMGLNYFFLCHVICIQNCEQLVWQKS